MEGGQRQEPLEEVVCQVEDAFSGAVIEAVTLRKGAVRSRPRPLPRPPQASQHTAQTGMPVKHEPARGVHIKNQHTKPAPI